MRVNCFQHINNFKIVSIARDHNKVTTKSRSSNDGVSHLVTASKTLSPDVSPGVAIRDLAGTRDNMSIVNEFKYL